MLQFNEGGGGGFKTASLRPELTDIFLRAADFIIHLLFRGAASHPS